MKLLEMTAPQIQNCVDHGDYEAQLIFRGKLSGDSWSQCPKCESARETEFKQRREDKKRSLFTERIHGAGIPLRFQGKSFDTFAASTPPQRQALDVAQTYVAGFEENLKLGRCLVFCGRAGCGKTHLATAIAEAILAAPFASDNWDYERWRKVKYATASDIIRSIRETWNGNGSETNVIANLVRPELLIIDEVGLQAGSESERNHLSEIIDKRYQKLLPTLVVSNVARQELPNFLGERAVDRLRENGGQIVIFDWQSHRGTTA